MRHANQEWDAVEKITRENAQKRQVTAESGEVKRESSSLSVAINSTEWLNAKGTRKNDRTDSI
jgi:hypothetical protein